MMLARAVLCPEPGSPSGPSAVVMAGVRKALAAYKPFDAGRTTGFSVLMSVGVAGIAPRSTTPLAPT